MVNDFVENKSKQSSFDIRYFKFGKNDRIPLWNAPCEKIRQSERFLYFLKSGDTAARVNAKQLVVPLSFVDSVRFGYGSGAPS